MDTQPVTGVSNSASYAAVLRLSRHRRGCILLDAPPNKTQPSTCRLAAHTVFPQPHGASLGKAVTTPWTTSQLPSSLCSVPTTHSLLNSQCDSHNKIRNHIKPQLPYFSIYIQNTNSAIKKKKENPAICNKIDEIEAIMLSEINQIKSNRKRKS